MEVSQASKNGKVVPANKPAQQPVSHATAMHSGGQHGPSRLSSRLKSFFMTGFLNWGIICSLFLTKMHAGLHLILLAVYLRQRPELAYSMP